MQDKGSNIEGLMPLQLSHLFFLLPLALALSIGLNWYAGVISVMLFFSVIFHGNPTRLFSIIDRTCACSLIFSNIILCALGGFALPHFAVVCALIPISFYFLYQEDRYSWNHSLWHVVSAYICIFSMLTYFVGTGF